MKREFRTIKVWQMDREKARVYGVRKFVDYEFNGENMEKFDKVDSMIEAIYGKEPVFETERTIADEEMLEFAEFLFSFSNQESQKPNWRGHSMSVSDLVVIGEHAFYCNSEGFEEIFK